MKRKIAVLMIFPFLLLAQGETMLWIKKTDSLKTVKSTWFAAPNFLKLPAYSSATGQAVGSIRYNSGAVQFYNGSTWTSVPTAVGAAGGWTNTAAGHTYNTNIGDEVHVRAAAADTTLASKLNVYGAIFATDSITLNASRKVTVKSRNTGDVMIGTSQLANATSYTAWYNTLVGFNNMSKFPIVSGWSNVLVGRQAGESVTSGQSNTFIGQCAGNSDSSGSYNVSLGYQALNSNIVGSNNVAIGSEALYLVTGSNNVGLGYRAGYRDNSGLSNRMYFNTVARATLAEDRSMSPMYIVSDASIANQTVTANGKFAVNDTAPKFTLSVRGAGIAKTLASFNGRGWTQKLIIDSLGTILYTASGNSDSTAMTTLVPFNVDAVTGIFRDSTAAGGMAIRVVNKSGATSVKGTLVQTSWTTDNADTLSSTNSITPSGVCLESGIADGALMWVAVMGKAYVIVDASAVTIVKGQVAYASQAGRINAGVAANLTATQHNGEVGHILTNTSSPSGKVLVKLHWN